jgi:hypothetical protein
LQQTSEQPAEDKASREAGDTRVTIGTLDAEALAYAAERGLAPRRWVDRLDWDAVERHDPVVYRPDGFDVILLPLEPGDRCQVHFVVAWTTGDPEEIATWFAANRPPEELGRLLAPAV